MELQIRYNPYSLCTRVYERDGDSWKQSDQDWIEIIQDKQLQTWFRSDPSKNWRGFADEVHDAANEHVKIFFEGRECDCSDLVNLTRSDDNRFEVVKPERYTLDDETAITKLTEIRNAIENSDFAESEKVKEALANYDNMKSGWFDIAVVAPMSSGKSTLINALMQGEYMPTGNMATTAKVFRIFNDESCDGFTYKSYSTDDYMLSEGNISSPDEMKQMNDSDEVSLIDITGRLPGIENSRFLRLRLIDTPGPNNAATDKHKKVAFSVIGDKKMQPMILFVRDITRLQNDSEDGLLREISAVINDSRQAKERFVFLMNRADVLNAEDEDARVFVERGKEYLSKMNIDSPMIIPISARAALLQSIELRGNELSEEKQTELQFFRKKLQNAKRDLVGAADLSPSVREQISSERDRDGANEASLTMINSGIRGLELTINEYLKKYAMPYKIYHCKNAIADLLRDLQTTLNLARTISEDQAALERSKATLGEIQLKVDGLKKASEDFRNMIDEVNDKKSENIVRKCCEGLSSIKDELQALINREGDILTADDNNDYISISSASNINSQVEAELKTCIEKMKEDLLKRLDEQIKADFSERYNRCREIVNEFKDMFDRIEGLDADSLSIFKGLIESFDDAEEFRLDSYMTENPISGQTVEATKDVENPERVGFWGFFKFWEPWKIPKTEEHKDMVLIREFRDTIAVFLDKVREKSENVITAGVKDFYTQKRNDLLAQSEMMTDVIQRETDRIQEIVDNVERKHEDIEANMRREHDIKEWISTLDALGEDA